MNLKIIKNYYHFISILIIGIVLRFYYSGLESYWFDEQIAFYVSDPSLTFEESFLRSLSTDRSPFLFNFLLKNWFMLFGYSPDMGRYFSVFSGILSIFVLAYLSFIISKKKPLFLVFFLSSFNIFLISYSAETRAYSTVFLFSLVNICFFFEVFLSKKKNILFLFLFSFFSIVALLLHPFTILILISELMFLSIYDFRNKKITYINYFIFFAIFATYLIIEHNYFLSLFNYSPPEFFVKNPNIDFLGNFYFSRFFGSKIMGVIYLFIFVFLLIKNINKIFNNKFYLFLFILFILTYAIPITYGYIFNPVLQDKYIIFVLIPIILLISCLVYELQNKKLKNLFIILIFISSITNQFFEIYNDNIDKPDFKKMVNILNKEEVKNIGIITVDKLHPYMVDVNHKDIFKERKIIKNYLKQFDSLNKNFVFFNQEEVPHNLKNIWLLCYTPIVENKCEENIRIKKDFEITKKISSYQLTSFLLNR